MGYDPDRHHRRSIRLKGYDYAQAGAYFVTICVHQRRSLLGQIINGSLQPSPAGVMVQQVWDEMPQHYAGVELDAFTLMPNHIHGIIVLCPTEAIAQPLILGDAVHRFKSFTTAQYRKGVYDQNWEPFAGRFWQRNYYEHIIRNEQSLNHIRHYIATNPQRWVDDTLNPSHPKSISPP